MSKGSIRDQARVARRARAGDCRAQRERNLLRQWRRYLDGRPMTAMQWRRYLDDSLITESAIRTALMRLPKRRRDRAMAGLRRVAKLREMELVGSLLRTLERY